MPKVYLCDTGLMQMLWLKRLQREVVGPVFETSVYSELLKRYGSRQVGFWRTADRREIDFVVRQPEATLLIETKLTFPSAVPAGLRSTADRSGDAAPSPAEEVRVVGLYGTPAEERMVYPWQLYAAEPAEGVISGRIPTKPSRR
jgi:hypothetical protein